MHPMVNIALAAARKAGEIIARAADRIDLIEVSRKASNDFVTEIDRAAEREIIFQLRKAYPDHQILAEESGPSGDDTRSGGFRWIIDPLDGTTNFVRGIPHFAVSIACARDGRLEHAVIVDPIRREEFTATRGAGAQLNGRRMRVSTRAGLKEAVLGTGIPFREPAIEYLPAYLRTLEQFTTRSAGIRRAGAATLDLAYVAAGRLDGFWEIGLQPWDIAAGALLVQEAGGLVSDFDGGNDWMDSGRIVAANPKCLKAMLQVIRPALGSEARAAATAADG
ncbi:MAG: inositol monophosphatase [Pseudomonadales bacterium]|jgi:myo-inositol-1(or 4)-monophosphatase|nr:inositol monophosphatase [Pseudomonadales bacterium]MCP5320911.1 inositol monophosphatase [Pseudomonadales bacterium]MCP5338304.1 inositol monophosphatase [Pseudomonadales bacterium]